MIERLLWVDPSRCNGCMECETACALAKTGDKDPLRSRIRVIDWQQKGLYLPITCQHCETAPCLAICPKEAISRDALSQRVLVDYGRCVSCRMCMAVCPFGAIKFDNLTRMVFKCDHCEGEPACVPGCEPEAIIYARAELVHTKKTRAAAARVVSHRTIGSKTDT